MRVRIVGIQTNEMRDPLSEGSLIAKTQYPVRHGAHRWEINVFAGDNQGLVVAMVE